MLLALGAVAFAGGAGPHGRPLAASRRRDEAAPLPVGPPTPANHCPPQATSGTRPASTRWPLATRLLECPTGSGRYIRPDPCRREMPADIPRGLPSVK